MTMTDRRKFSKAPDPEPCLTPEQTPDQVRAILWKIARNDGESSTARVAACRLLLMDFRERGDGVEGTRASGPEPAC
jgi:hypothetical protein